MPFISYNRKSAILGFHLRHIMSYQNSEAFKKTDFDSKMFMGL